VPRFNVRDLRMAMAIPLYRNAAVIK
jgi:hypothetical protein